MAKLISKTYGDALFAVASEEKRMDEFYEAAQAGMKVERVYVVRSRSFDRRSKFVYDGETKLQITRVYDRLDGLTELHCSDMKVD